MQCQTISHEQGEGAVNAHHDRCDNECLDDADDCGRSFEHRTSSAISSNDKAIIMLERFGSAI